MKQRILFLCKKFLGHTADFIIHMLVVDTGENVIIQSLPLIAGRTAQVYNVCKKRKVHSGKIDINFSSVSVDNHAIFVPKSVLYEFVVLSSFRDVPRFQESALSIRQNKNQNHCCVPGIPTNTLI